MKRDDRRQAIMDLLAASRAVVLDALADRFGVSRMTIHRDLDDLEQSGLLRKVRGGATIESGTRFESDFRIRALQDIDAKTELANARKQMEAREKKRAAADVFGNPAADVAAEMKKQNAQQEETGTAG